MDVDTGGKGRLNEFPAQCLEKAKFETWALAFPTGATVPPLFPLPPEKQHERLSHFVLEAALFVWSAATSLPGMSLSCLLLDSREGDRGLSLSRTYMKSFSKV